MLDALYHLQEKKLFYGFTNIIVLVCILFQIIYARKIILLFILITCMYIKEQTNIIITFHLKRAGFSETGLRPSVK